MKKIFLISTLILSLAHTTFPSFAMTEADDDGIISIQGLKRIDVLKALWNNATGCSDQPQNQLAYQQTRQRLFPQDEVDRWLHAEQHYFDRLSSRVLKVTFYGNETFDPFNYNTNHGDGRAERVIASLRKTGSTDLLDEDKAEAHKDHLTEQSFYASLASEPDPETVVAQRREDQKKLDAAKTEEEKARIVFASAGWDPDEASDIMKRLQTALDAARGKGKK